MSQLNAHAHRTKQILTVSLLIAGIITALLCSLCLGNQNITIAQLIAALDGEADKAISLSIFNIRLPRTMAGIGCGICLAVAGCLLQRITRNPLADTGILGINGTAALAVVLLLLTYQKRGLAPLSLISIAAITGALLGGFLLLYLTWSRKPKSPTAIILVGIALSASTYAIAQTIILILDPSLIRWLTAWQLGTLSGMRTTPSLCILTFGILACPIALLLFNDLRVYQIGDDSAHSLGINIFTLRNKVIIFSTVLAAAAVAWCGPFGFVGFLSPHIARQCVGHGIKIQLAVSALVGALILLSSDFLGRIILSGNEIPAGALLGAIGGPAFLFALSKWQRQL